MKKLMYGGLFLALVGIGIVGCKKEVTGRNQNSENTVTKNNLDNIPLIEPSKGQNIEVINDDDEIKLNKQLKSLASATKDLIKNDKFNQMIIRLAKESNVNTVYYTQIMEEAPEYYNLINQNLKELGTSVEELSSSMTHKPILPSPEYPETTKIEKYEPAIIVPNLSSLNENQMTLISPNEEYLYNNEVYILAWYYNQKNELKETIVGEKTATKTSNPIFIVDHAIPRDEMTKIGDFLNSDFKKPQIQK